MEMVLRIREEVAAAMRSAGAAIGRVGDQAGQAAGQLDKMDDHGKKAGISLNGLRGALVGLGVVQTVRASVSAVKEFEQSLTETGTLAGVARAQVAAWREEMLRAGPALGQTPEAMAEALKKVASSGVPVAQALNIVKASAKGAAVGLGEVNDVANVATSVMNAYRGSNLQADAAIGIMIAGAREGKYEVREFASSIGNVLGVAATLGVEFNELAAGTAFLSRSGLSAGMAITGMRQIIAKVLAPTRQARKTFDDLGLSFTDLQDTFKNEGFLAGVQKLRSELDNVNLRRVIDDIEGYNAVLAFTGQQSKEAESVFASLAAAGAGDLSTAFKEAAKYGALPLNQAVALLHAGMISLGDQVMPLLIKAIAAALKVWEAFTGKTVEAENRLKALKIVVFAAAAGLAVWAAVIATMKIAAFLQGLTAMAIGFVAQATATGSATAALVAFRTALISTGIGALIVAVGLLILGLVYLAQRTVEVNGVMISGWAKARAEFAGLMAFIVSAASGMWNAAKVPLENLGAALSHTAAASMAAARMDWATAGAEGIAARDAARKTTVDASGVIPAATAAATRAYNTSVNRSAAGNGLNEGIYGRRQGPGQDVQEVIDQLLNGDAGIEAGVNPEEAAGGSKSGGGNSGGRADRDRERIVKMIQDLRLQAVAYKQTAEQREYLGKVQDAGYGIMGAELDQLNEALALTDAQVAGNQRLIDIREIARALSQKNDAEREESIRLLGLEGQKASQLAALWGQSARAMAIETAVIEARNEALREQKTLTDDQVIAERAAAAAKYDAERSTRDNTRIRDQRLEAQQAVQIAALMTQDSRARAINTAVIQAQNDALRQGEQLAPEVAEAIREATATIYDATTITTFGQGIRSYVMELKDNVMTIGQMTQEGLGSVFDGIMGLANNLFSGQKMGWRETAADVSKSIALMIAKMLLMKAVMAAMNFMFPGSGTVASAAGASNLSNMLGGQSMIPTLNANGNAYDKGLVDQAMAFRSGSDLGVLGEAGPEGILPLKRMGNGKLGVYAAGAGEVAGMGHEGRSTAGGETNVTVQTTVEVNFTGSGNAQTDAKAMTALQETLGSVIDEKIQQALRRASREGGQMKPVFG